MKTDREKLSELVQEANKEISKLINSDELTDAKTAWLAFADYLIEHGVTVQKRISVKERTPTEADGTECVCLADVFPYNEKEPYIDAKHDRRIAEAYYSEFCKRWYENLDKFLKGEET